MELTPIELSRLMWSSVREYYQLKKNVWLPEWHQAGALRTMTIGSVERLIRSPEMGPEACFGNWYAASIQSGWTWGPRIVVRQGIKTNPRLKPWAELGRIEQGTTDLIVSVFRQWKNCIPAIDVARTLGAPSAARGTTNIFNAPVKEVLNLDLGR